MTEQTRGVDAWKAHTSAFDRVQAVASTVSQPRSASYIASEAFVAENTARNHLERLVTLHVLVKTEQDGGARYAPDPLHTRLQTIRELLAEYDRDGLIQLKAELQTQIEEWQSEYDVSSPAELRTLAAETTTETETRAIRRTANDWDLLKYRLDIVEESIERYETYNRDPVSV